MSDKNKKENHEKYCIFEKMICKFASNKDRVFECKAPSDEEMVCNK